MCRILHQMCSMLFSLFLKVYTFRDQKCLPNDGNQWIRFLYFCSSSFLSSLKIIGIVCYYTWSWTYFNVLWEITNFSPHNYLCLCPSDWTWWIQRCDIFSIDSCCGMMMSNIDGLYYQFRDWYIFHGYIRNSIRYNFTMLLSRTRYLERINLCLSSRPQSHPWYPSFLINNIIHLILKSVI